MQVAGAYGYNKKIAAKAMLKFEKIWILKTCREYLLCLQCNASRNFLQTCIKFVEQKFIELVKKICRTQI